MTNDQELLTVAYRAFNARDLESALATMHTEVEWPNTMEGGYVHGHEGVSAYWTKQWQMVDPHVEPLQFAMDAEGRNVLDVHQSVYDLQGNPLEDLMVQHIYQIEEGLIRRMEMGEERIMASGGDR